MRPNQVKNVTMQLTPSEQALIQLIRDTGHDNTAAFLNDIYAVAAFHFPDHLPYHHYIDSFRMLHDLMDALHPQPFIAWNKQISCECEQ